MPTFERDMLTVAIVLTVYGIETEFVRASNQVFGELQ